MSHSSILGDEPPLPATSIEVPALLIAMEYTVKPVEMVLFVEPVLAFQKITVPDTAPASRLPLGCQASERTRAVVLMVRSLEPLETCQMTTWLLSLPAAIFVLSGENVSPLTFLLVVKEPMLVLLVALQSWTFPTEPTARICLFGLYVTL